MSSSLDDLRSRVEVFVGENLNSCSENSRTGYKIINDKVWGSVTLYGWEVKIIDQPLLQRLRYISQTGTAYYTYPTANHNRFQHSIGVLGVLNNVVKQINLRNEICQQDCKINDSIFYILRLAALLHDIGHGLFSHVSERIYSEVSEFNDYWNDVRIQLEGNYKTETEKLLKDCCIDPVPEEIKKDLGLKPIGEEKNWQFYGSRAKPHEILSSLFVESTAFFNFFKSNIVPEMQGDFKNIYLPLNFDQNIKKILKIISKCIVGIPPIFYDPDKKVTLIYTYMSNLINGAFDVDKLDYLARDNYTAGLFITYDIERLLQKIFIYKKNGLTENINLVELAMDIGASHVFEQIVIGKLMLFFYIYHHHKVLTSDYMLAKICRLLSKNTLKEERYCIFKHSFDLVEKPEAIFTSNFKMLLGEIEGMIKNLQNDDTLSTAEKATLRLKLNVSWKMIQDFSSRNLHKRALIILPDYISGANKPDENLSDIFNEEFEKELARLIVEFLRWLDNSRREVIQKLGNAPECDIAKNYIALIDNSDNPEEYAYFFERIVPKPPKGNEAKEMVYLKWPDTNPISHGFHVDDWIKAYIKHRWAIIFVAQENLRVIVNVLGRHLLYKKRKLVLNRISLLDAHLDIPEVNNFIRMMKTLSETNGCPLELNILENIDN